MKNNTKQQRILKYLNIILTIICIVCLMSSGVVYAATSDLLSIKNIFQTDKVNIELKTMAIDEENKVKELDGSIMVEPGKTLSYIPTIKNLGTDAYVRAYVHFGEDSGLNISELDEMSNKWKYNQGDGYFYYQDVISHNDAIELCKQIHIPTDYGNTDTKFDVKVTVDVIQARNFKPDFNSNQPWGQIEIKKYIDNGAYQYQKSENKINKIDITYNGKSNELVSNKKDFFNDLPPLVPGDHYQNTMTVVNNFDQGIKLYFEAHPNKKLAIPNDLLKQITLKITSDDGTEIYNGDLAKDIENQAILELKAKQIRQIIYEIELSKDADNAFANLDNVVNWYFNTSFESKKIDVKKEDDNVKMEGEKIDEKKPVNKVKTGDETNDRTCLILFVSGIVSGICALYLNRSRKKYCGDHVE